MILHIWSVLAQKAVVDTDTSTLSLIDTIDGISLPSDIDPNNVRAIIPECEFISLWIREDINKPVKGMAEVIIHNELGRKLTLANFEIDLVNNLRVRTRLHIENLTIRALGRLVFEVKLQLPDRKQWQTATKLQLDITIESSKSED